MLWLYKNEYEPYISLMKFTNRITHINIKIANIHIDIIGVYLTCMGNSDSSPQFDIDLIELESTIHKIIMDNNKTPETKHTILIGDFNSDIMRLDNNHKYLYKHDEKLKNFVDRNNIKLLDYEYHQLVPNTFKNRLSRIDHIGTLDTQTCITQVKYILDQDEIESCNKIRTLNQDIEDQLKSVWHELNLSDHRAIEASIKLQLHPNELKHNNKIQHTIIQPVNRLNWRNEKLKEKYHDLLEVKLTASNKLSLLEYDTNLEEISTIIVNDFKTTIQLLKNNNEQPHYHKCNEWWDNEMQNIKDQRQKWYNIKKDSNNAFATNKYEYFRKLFKIKQNEKIYMSRNLNMKQLQLSYEQNMTKFWKRAKQMQHNQTNPEIDMNILHDKYEKLFNETLCNDQLHIKEVQKATEENREFKDMAEKSEIEQPDPQIITTIIEKMNNNKQEGPTGLANETFKYAPKIITLYIAYIIFQLMNTIAFNIPFNMGRIIPIIKDPKVSNKSCDNIRPLTISDSMATILEMYLLHFINKQIKDHRLQFGFREGYSCMHAIYTVKETISYYISKGKPVYAVALDFSQAFDKVNRTILLNKLAKLKLSPRLWLLVYKYYNTTKVYVENKEETSKTFRTTTGVKQGGPMSPKLFAIYMDEMLEEISKLPGGCHMDELILSIIAYADDTLLLFESEEYLQKAITIVERYCKTHAIKINEKKSQYIIFGTSKQKSAAKNITVNNINIEKTCQIKYLGVIINDNLNSEQSIKPRKDKFLKSTYGLGSVGINNDNINAILKGFLIKTYCLPVLYYGIETTPVNITQVNSIKSTVSLSIKRLLNIEKLAHSSKLLSALKIEIPDRNIIRRKLNSIYQLINNPSTRPVMIKIGNYINKMIESNNQKKLSKFITFEFMNIMELDKFDLYQLIAKSKEITSWILIDNRLLERDNEIIELRSLLTVPSTKNWTTINNILRPDVVNDWVNNNININNTSNNTSVGG
jgi:hypothetical protein